MILLSMLFWCYGGCAGSFYFSTLDDQQDQKREPEPESGLETFFDIRGEWFVDLGNEKYGYPYLRFAIHEVLEEEVIREDKTLEGKTAYEIRGVLVAYGVGGHERTRQCDIEFVIDHGSPNGDAFEINFYAGSDDRSLWHYVWIKAEPSGCWAWRDYLKDSMEEGSFVFDCQNPPTSCRFSQRSAYPDSDRWDGIFIEQER